MLIHHRYQDQRKSASAVYVKDIWSNRHFDLSDAEIMAARPLGDDRIEIDWRLGGDDGVPCTVRLGRSVVTVAELLAIIDIPPRRLPWFAKRKRRAH